VGVARGRGGDTDTNGTGIWGRAGHDGTVSYHGHCFYNRVTVWHLAWDDWQLESLLRILLGTVLGGAIGYERDLHGRPAGLRTNAIVALASATFMVVSTRFIYFQHYQEGQLVGVDGSRIAASVVSGIGFLGAGAILRTGLTIKGLTTAAGLWLVSAIGMAAGGGMYLVSIFVTLVGLSALTMLRRFEDRAGPVSHQRISVVVDEANAHEEIAAALRAVGATLSHDEYERDLDGRLRLTFDARITGPTRLVDLARAVEGVAGVRRLKIEKL
jgi:putative Mg2+ transporter-C (MgtC) family protein